MTQSQRDLLDWLSREEFSQYGECHGKDLDALIEAGLAQLHGPETELDNTFIAKGRGIMFRAVSLTAAGLAKAQQLRGKSDHGVLIISGLSPSDTTFENDLGTWNVTRAERDCQRGRHKRWLIDTADAYAANIKVEVDEHKIAAMVADPDRLADSPPLISVIENGLMYVIDGHHRLRALHRLGVVDCICWVIEEADTARYKVLFNGKRKLSEAKRCHDARNHR